MTDPRDPSSRDPSHVTPFDPNSKLKSASIPNVTVGEPGEEKPKVDNLKKTRRTDRQTKTGERFRLITFKPPEKPKHNQ